MIAPETIKVELCEMTLPFFECFKERVRVLSLAAPFPARAKADSQDALPGASCN
jgi:hypothetical protein